MFGLFFTSVNVLLVKSMKDAATLLERKLYRHLREALEEFSLIADGDKILVGLSGGKDSLTLLDLLVKWRRASKTEVDFYAVHIRVEGVDYRTDELYLANFCRDRGVDYLSKTISFAKDADERRTPCFLCSWNRRKALFETAQELGCGKIALGHHQDDVLQTALMNLSFNGSFSTMPALLRMRKMPLAIIRPLCSVPEQLIREWAALQAYQPLIKVCPHDSASKRNEVKNLMESFAQFSPEYRASLWNALKKEGKMVEM